MYARVGDPVSGTRNKTAELGPEQYLNVQQELWVLTVTAEGRIRESDND